MTIALHGKTVSGNAPKGTLVGTFSDTHSSNVAYILLVGADFTISSDKLLTNWSGTLLAGMYKIRVLAFGWTFVDHAIFYITVTKSGLHIVGDPSSIIEVPLTKGE